MIVAGHVRTVSKIFVQLGSQLRQLATKGSSKVSLNDDTYER